jgi:hypothetical protein
VIKKADCADIYFAGKEQTRTQKIKERVQKTAKNQNVCIPISLFPFFAKKKFDFDKKEGIVFL